MSAPLSITLLGTGTSQGIPVIGCRCPVCTSPDPRDQRTRAAAFIQAGRIGLSIDIGPDFRAQMLRAGLDDVHAVLMTHEHNDHTSGLDDLRPINFLHNRNIPIYGAERTLSEMKSRFSYAFDEAYRYPGKPRVHLQAIEDHPFETEGIRIIPVPVDHGDMSIYGFRVGTVAYITDAKSIPDKSKSLLQGLDVLVLNALRMRPHPTHLSLPEAIEVYEELQPNRCYITHISHDMGRHGEVEAGLPKGMYLGFDNLHIDAQI